MMDDTSVPPDGLPPVLSLVQLCWLSGLSTARIGQLVASGTVSRLGRDRYSTASVRKILEHQRTTNTGPQDWNKARVDLTREKAATARLVRLEKEGALMPRAYVIDFIAAICSGVRDRMLAIASKTAQRLAVTSRPAECEKIVYTEITEALEALSKLKVEAVPWRPGAQPVFPGHTNRAEADPNGRD
jgi:hypothetical protein